MIFTAPIAGYVIYFLLKLAWGILVGTAKVVEGVVEGVASGIEEGRLKERAREQEQRRKLDLRESSLRDPQGWLERQRRRQEDSRLGHPAYVQGLRVNMDLKPLHGLSWYLSFLYEGWVRVLGVDGDRVVDTFDTTSLAEAQAFRESYVPPGYEWDDPRLADYRRRLQEEERRYNELDGTPHPGDWPPHSERSLLGDLNGLRWWFLKGTDRNWVVGYRQRREVVNCAVKDEDEALRFRRGYQPKTRRPVPLELPAERV